MADWSELRVKGKFTIWRVGVAKWPGEGCDPEEMRSRGPDEGRHREKAGVGENCHNSVFIQRKELINLQEVSSKT